MAKTASIFTKHIKLHPKHRALRWGSKIVPSLYLSGVWLEEQGFRVGSQVTVTIKNKQLTIKAAK